MLSPDNEEGKEKKGKAGRSTEGLIDPQLPPE
jgi:hypothetical protein